MTDMLKMQTDKRPELYVSQYSFDEYLGCISDVHPELYSLINHERFCNAEQYISKMNVSSWEFENEEMGGRGSAYNVAQKSANNRKLGMTKLLRCFTSSSGFPDQSFKILDVLGGDGTLARFCKNLGHQAPTIYTADISKFMIDACHEQALPCVRQSATTSLFQDNVLDGILIAYGSHHLDSSARSQAVSEAHRTLKVGGRLVLHDFEIGGKCAEWFDTVVHPYSLTGHPHPHFSREEMFCLFENAGFCDINVFSIDDSFTLDGHSPEEAKHNAIMHMYDMYGLVKIGEAANDILTRLEQLITETLGPISIRKKGARYIATIPREALVASGTR